MLKLALRHGLPVTAAIAAWVALKHFALHLAPGPGQWADLAVFNLSAIAGLALGVRARRRENGGALGFLDGWKTGLAIAATYALATSLYFVAMLALVGPSLMQQSGETSYAQAFAGVSIGFFVFGAVFSSVIALAMRRAR